MLTVNAICELSQSNPGKMLYVNVGGYLYGLSGSSDNTHQDYVIYASAPVTRDSRPTSDLSRKEPTNVIGVDPVTEKVRAAIESNVNTLVDAVVKAVK